MNNPDGTGHPNARGDGTASLCPTCGDCRITVRLDVSQVTQISTKLREATGAGRQPTGHPGGERPAPPQPPRAPAKPSVASRSRTHHSPLRRHDPPAQWSRLPPVTNDAMRDTMRTIGLRLQQIRIARNKSLRVAAGLAGMSKDTLNRIEHGKRDLGLSESVALANALGIPPEKLITLPISAPGTGPAFCDASGGE